MANIRKPLPQIRQDDFPKLTDDGFRWLDLVRQYSIDIRCTQVVIDPPNMAAHSVNVLSTTVKGARVGDIILQVNSTSNTTGVFVTQAIVIADELVEFHFVNIQSIAVDKIADTYTIVYIKNNPK